ncbi:YfaP family protein [Pseudomonas sp. LRF_L74]|uniref:YfaP family protein n=1 Tax=Pseudomonas sp. LRF_L74 TaxID=3369422 RepID=UPI003F61EFCB
MRRLLSFVGLAMMVPVALAEPSAELEGPTGGWRFSGLIDRDDQPRVAYPTPPIDRGAQRGRSMIEGTLKNLKGARQPHRLVVNGNPLPLYTDDDGRFVRPYNFGAGSNSVEVVSGDGKSIKRIQFYEANHLKTPARVRIVLGWDDPKAELDLHVVTPDGQHAYWAAPVMSNGGGLDTDSVDGPGPEMFTMTAPLRGTYLVYVNYWGNLNENGYNFEAGSNQNEVITSQVSLVFNENTPNEKRETFVVPLRGIGDLQFIKAFNY